MWPMLRGVIANSRLIGVTADAVAEGLHSQWPVTPIATIAPAAAAPAIHGRDARSLLGLPDDAVIFGTLGARDARDAAMRRLSPVLQAYASTARRIDGTCLVVAGDVDPRAMAVPPDLTRQVHLTGAQTEPQIAHVAAAVDVWIDLRWPDHEIISDEWLAAGAAGRPTVTFDLPFTADRPMLDPRSWQSPAGQSPIGVAIDILDEEHSLRLALYRLAHDAPLRQRLGEGARAYWRDRHTIAHMTAGWIRAIDRASNVRAPSSSAGRPAMPGASTATVGRPSW
jgi:hypothetical protein